MQALGALIGGQGWQIVHGGTGGLPAIAAQACRDAGGRTLCVTESMPPQVPQGGAAEFLVIQESAERRLREVRDSAWAYVVCPGGSGTGQELYRVWFDRNLKLHEKPIVLFNVAGLCDSLIAHLDATVEQGFESPKRRDRVKVVSEPEGVVEELLKHAPAS